MIKTTEAIAILKKGGVGVMMTDTIFGVVGSALKQKTVERIYAVRERNAGKPMIILIASIGDLKRFGVKPTPGAMDVLKKVWPGPVSVILKCEQEKFSYLHRGAGTLAFRLPKDAKLRKFLAETGPLVAPSANPEGLSPARTIAEAERYFADAVDFYLDGTSKNAAPSTIIEIKR